ncbi:MAG: hypothetical protein Q7S92_03275 [Candidatus Diapherotrites archaeon]|nr:hypothetical protein [Candidatus Diapherotrites archaeon]
MDETSEIIYQSKVRGFTGSPKGTAQIVITFGIIFGFIQGILLLFDTFGYYAQVGFSKAPLMVLLLNGVLFVLTLLFGFAILISLMPKKLKMYATGIAASYPPAKTNFFEWSEIESISVSNLQTIVIDGLNNKISIIPVESVPEFLKALKKTGNLNKFNLQKTLARPDFKLSASLGAAGAGLYGIQQGQKQYKELIDQIKEILEK